MYNTEVCSCHTLVFGTRYLLISNSSVQYYTNTKCYIRRIDILCKCPKIWMILRCRSWQRTNHRSHQKFIQLKPKGLGWFSRMEITIHLVARRAVKKFKKWNVEGAEGAKGVARSSLVLNKPGIISLCEKMSRLLQIFFGLVVQALIEWVTAFSTELRPRDRSYLDL